MKRVIPIAATLAVAACGADEPGRLPMPADPVEVTVSALRRAPAVESFPARVVSERTADVATRMSGTVQRVHVDVGARVRRGDALVSLDAADIQARVGAARAQEELATRTFQRVENLHRDRAASQQELDQATAALDGARARRTEAEAQRAYAVVTAPFEGVVTQRMADPGDLAVPGRPLLTVVAPGALKVVADLPAGRAGSLEPGGEARIRVDGTAHAVRITRVVPALGEGSRTFRVEAALEGAPAGLVPGSYGRLEVERTGEGPRWIPADAVVDRGQLTGVYAVEADTVRLRWVRLGQRTDDAVELLSGPVGLNGVVRRPAPELFDGRPVSATRQEAWGPSGLDVAAEVAGPSTAAGGEVDR
jgi:RND family efflux transporter MFP subunit